MAYPNREPQLQRLLAQRAAGWSEGAAEFDHIRVRVEFRNLSPDLHAPLRIVPSAAVAMDVLGGARHASTGFGTAVVLSSPRCERKPECALLPPDGVYRPGVVWLEQATADAPPTLVVADPLRTPVVHVDGVARRLALDTSAPLAASVAGSRLQWLARLGLLRGSEVGRRAGVHRMQDYDPHKRPLVMIHGLASSPLTWSCLTNAIWGDPVLRAHFQVWHVLYQTNAPTIVARKRVQSYLEHAWSLLDPEHTHASRDGIVLVGHSLGGVIARLLCSDSGRTLWDAGFTLPPESVHGDPEDTRSVEAHFAFDAYPGVRRAIFLAAPHRGSPKTRTATGRAVRVLVGPTPEIDRLRRLALAHPDAVRPALRTFYRRGAVNSITSLQVEQPIRVASEQLMPRPGIPYHTIAAVLPQRREQTDGTVPLASALLDGARSTLVVPSGHLLCSATPVLEEVLRILHEDVEATR